MYRVDVVCARVQLMLIAVSPEVWIVLVRTLHKSVNPVGTVLQVPCLLLLFCTDVVRMHSFLDKPRGRYVYLAFTLS